MFVVLRRFLPERIKGPLRAERDRWYQASAVAENVTPFASRLRTTIRLRLASRRILCHPGHPSRYQVLYKTCAINGYPIVTDTAEPYDLAVHFTDGGPCELPPDVPVINRHCTDISKRHVAAVLKRTFGYDLAVDPTTHHGPMVEKSDGNYTHDGRVVEGPIPRSAVVEGCVYQRLIDSREGEEAIDLRTPIYGGHIPLVYIKHRPLATRFANENTFVEVREPDEVYSAEEMDLLAKFVAEMRLDFGELDVLRDGQGGRIYVVDVANTPAGPPNGLPQAPARRAIRRLSCAFRALVLNMA